MFVNVFWRFVCKIDANVVKKCVISPYTTALFPKSAGK